MLKSVWNHYNLSDICASLYINLVPTLGDQETLVGKWGHREKDMKFPFGMATPSTPQRLLEG
jgi:hypothetical protein